MKLKLRIYVLTIFSFHLLLAVLVVLPVFAQDGTPQPTELGVSPWALLIGSGITFAVTLLKRIPFVRNNPKLVATVISVVVTAITAVAGARAGAGVLPFVLTALTQLAAAIGTHEAVVKSLTPSS